MGKKKKKDSDEKKDEGSNNEEKIYEVKSLDDYFFIVRDVFSEFKTFVSETNSILNTTLGAVRDIIPMIINGNPDYEKVFQIVENVNSALKEYIDKQNNLINKITSASDILSKDIRWDHIIIELLSGNRNTSKKEQKTSIIKNDVIPSFSIKNNDKKIEELFGIKPITEEKSGKEKEKDE
ncbi:MAG: hypothetical protein NZ927_09265 [Candidatus Calescibacterium sp.]|nr:hypothetical protein [Candidatus Calescibacterium sp.]MCX7734148.1 hypothetical protein [bacterium]MDW8087859.1 hypothetical protein [Candidatus Calescibacterium sp.]